MVGRSKPSIGRSCARPCARSLGGTPSGAIRRNSAAFKFGDEEDLAAFADRLEIGGLVERAVDGDGGFFFEVVAETRVELVHGLDDAAQIPGLDGEFAHPAGVPPAEAGGKHDARLVCSHRTNRPPRRGRGRRAPWGATWAVRSGGGGSHCRSRWRSPPSAARC